MDLNDWKKLAEREVSRYRDNQAYVRGVLDGGGTGGERMQRCARWVLAVDYTRAHLKRTDPQKAEGFSKLFGLDAPIKSRNAARTAKAVSIELNMSITTVYRWKSEALSLVLLAAAQTGALRPYTVDPH